MLAINKIRILGIILFIAGILVMSSLESKDYNLLAGLLLGAGLGLTVTGRIGRKK